MKGAAAGTPGEVRLIDFPEPELQDGDVILAPLACGICTTDVKLVQKGSKEIGYALGHEIAGEIVAVSPGSGPAGGWQIGQRVVAAPYLPCGTCFYCMRNLPTLCVHLFDTYPIPGGLAEQVKIPCDLASRGLLEIPAGLSAEAACLAEPFGCVIQGLEACRVQAGDSVLVVGDGPMGLMAAAVARAWGASPVVVAGMLPHRLKTAGEHYADAVVDVCDRDLLRETKALTGGRGMDAVIVAVSSGEALAGGIACVRPGGAVNAFAGVSEGTTIPLDIRKLHYQQIILTGSFGVAPRHMARALELLASGALDPEPLITARFPFTASGEAVAYAANRTGLKAVVVFQEQT